MDSKVKVSVIVPVYNSGRYLKECLDSIIKQTYSNLEIILVDDGSDDNSLDILLEYAHKDNRIKIIKQQRKGAAVARNLGIEMSTGEYVLFLDSDDIFDLSFVEKTIQKAILFDADIVICNAIKFKNDINNLRHFGTNFKSFPLDNAFSPNEHKEDIFNSFLVQAWNKLIRKKLLEKNHIFFQNIKRTNDLLFTCKVLVNAEKIILVDDILVYYRIGQQNNLQSNNDKAPLEFYKSLFELKKYLKNRQLYDIYFFSYIKLVIDIILYNLISLKNKHIRKLVFQELYERKFELFSYSDYLKLKSSSYIKYLQYGFLIKYNIFFVCKILYFSEKVYKCITLNKLKDLFRMTILGYISRWI